MIRLAIRMFFGAPGRLIGMLMGATFAAFLMLQQLSIFWGVMTWTYAPMRIIRAQVWISAPKVQQINDYDPVRSVDVQRVASVDGVAWAAPILLTTTFARTTDGTNRPIHLIGVDDYTFAGAPWPEVAGGIDTLMQPESIWVDEYALERLAPEGGPSLKINDVLEINERRAVIKGVFPSRRAFSGNPFILTTYQRAVDFSLPQRRYVSFVIAQPNVGTDASRTAEQISHETGLRAFTEGELVDSTVWWWMRNTGVPGSFLFTVILSVVFGITVVGLSFANYVTQTRVHFAAMRAMGASGPQLGKMLFVQSLTVFFLSYTFALLLALLFGRLVESSGVPPFKLTWEIGIGVLVAQLGIGILSPLRAVWSIVRIPPDEVFKSR